MQRALALRPPRLRPFSVVSPARAPSGRESARGARPDRGGPGCASARAASPRDRSPVRRPARSRPRQVEYLWVPGSFLEQVRRARGAHPARTRAGDRWSPRGPVPMLAHSSSSEARRARELGLECVRVLSIDRLSSPSPSPPPHRSPPRFHPSSPLLPSLPSLLLTLPPPSSPLSLSRHLLPPVFSRLTFLGYRTG